MPVRPPLVVTGDPTLLEELLRLAAAAGTTPDVACDPAAARPRYRGAPLVVIGADMARACIRARLPRRSDVVLVGRDRTVDTVWDLAEPLGAEHVATLPVAEEWLIQRFRRPTDDAEPGQVLAVIGGRGGAGASVLAAGLAVTAVGFKRRTLLIDADPLGGGLDLILGWESRDGLRWSALAEAAGPVDPPALLEALPQHGDLVLLSFDRDDGRQVPAAAMAATLDAGRRGRDVVVADLPRRLDDAAVMALQTANRALLVVPAELRAVAASARVAAMVATHCEDLSVVVRGPAPGRIKAREVSRALGLPLAGTLRPETSLAESLERGEPPALNGRGPLADLCKRLITELLPS